MTKNKVFKDYSKLDLEIKELIHQKYPFGFEKKLVSFTDHKGNKSKALTFETEETSYLIKATVEQSRLSNPNHWAETNNDVFDLETPAKEVKSKKKKVTA